MKSKSRKNRSEKIGARASEARRRSSEARTAKAFVHLKSLRKSKRRGARHQISLNFSGE
jgi:hypothetical protein